MSQYISNEVYKDCLEACWNVTLDIENVFPPKICEWVNVTSTKLGVPCVYVAYPFISAVAYMLGVSEVQVCESYREPVIIYSLVSGRSGTNKSGSLSVIRKLIEATCQKKLFGTGTMEGIMVQLRENDGSLLSMVDEFCTFVDSLDKNANGNSERSRYLSLRLGVHWAKRTKNNGLEEISNPRFHLCGFNQNYFLINMIGHSDQHDGFLARFLVASPSEVFVTLDKNIKANFESTIDMIDVFHIVNRLFEKGHVFRVDVDALDVFRDFHDNYVLQERERDKFEDQKSMLLSKSCGNALRVAAVQCALRTSG